MAGELDYCPECKVGRLRVIAKVPGLLESGLAGFLGKTELSNSMPKKLYCKCDRCGHQFVPPGLWHKDD